MTDLATNLARAARASRAEGAIAAVSIDADRRVAATGSFTADALVRIASVTKPMLATAALRAGADLDRPLIEDLPELRGVWRASPEITLRHVFTQTTGLHPDLDLPVAHGLGDGDDALDRAIEIVVGRGQRYPVGTSWEYCNAGFWLAGHSLATRAGTTFEQFMADRLFEPLGMTRTGFRGGDYPRARRPGGGLWSTADEVLTFGEFLVADPAGREILARLSRPVTQVTVLGTAYGMALQIGEGGVFWHNGDFGGYHARLTLVPERRLAVFTVERREKASRLRDRVTAAELHRVGLPDQPGPLRSGVTSVRAMARLHRAVRAQRASGGAAFGPARP